MGIQTFFILIFFPFPRPGTAKAETNHCRSETDLNHFTQWRPCLLLLELLIFRLCSRSCFLRPEQLRGRCEISSCVTRRVLGRENHRVMPGGGTSGSDPPPAPDEFLHLQPNSSCMSAHTVHRATTKFLQEHPGNLHTASQLAHAAVQD